MRIGIDLQTVQLLGVHQRKKRLPESLAGKDDNFLFQILEFLQSHVQEVARTAGRVEHPQMGQVLEEGPHLLGGDLPGLAPAGGQVRFEVLPQLGPLPPQRLHDHRLHQGFDVLPAGVVGAKLGSGRRIEAPLE